MRVGVGVVHGSGWAIGVYSGWLVIYENVEELEVEPRLGVGEDRPATPSCDARSRAGRAPNA